MLKFIEKGEVFKSVHKLCIEKNEKALTSVKACIYWWRIPDSNR
jgi:hypothetical protein